MPLTSYTLHIHRNFGRSSETALKASSLAVAKRKAEKLISSGTSPGELRGASLHSKHGAAYLEFDRQDPKGGTVWAWRTLLTDLRPGHCGPCGLGFNSGYAIGDADVEARRVDNKTYLILHKSVPVAVASARRNLDRAWKDATQYAGRGLDRSSEWRALRMFSGMNGAVMSKAKKGLSFQAAFVSA